MFIASSFCFEVLNVEEIFLLYCFIILIYVGSPTSRSYTQNDNLKYNNNQDFQQKTKFRRLTQNRMKPSTPLTEVNTTESIGGPTQL